MECKCSMRIKVIGDGCSVCNPEMAQQIEDDNAFDNYFDERGYDEEHRMMFNSVWNAAVLYQVSKR